MSDWLRTYWLFNTPGGWLVVITGILAIVTGSLAYVTWRTAQRAKDSAEAAVRSAEIAEQDLKRRSTPIVMPYGFPQMSPADNSLPASVTIHLANVSSQPAFALFIEVSYHGRGQAEDGWADQGLIQRNWQEFGGIEEDVPQVIEPGGTREFYLSPPQDVLEAQATGDINVTHISVSVSYTDGLGSRYESASELRTESGTYHWSYINVGDETHWS